MRLEFFKFFHAYSPLRLTPSKIQTCVSFYMYVQQSINLHGRLPFLVKHVIMLVSPFMLSSLIIFLSSCVCQIVFLYFYYLQHVTIVDIQGGP